MSVLHVACAVDRRFAAHSAAMLHSVLACSGGDEVSVHFMHTPRFPARSATRLRQLVEHGGGSLSLLEVPDERIAGLPAMPRRGITATMWYRIFLPELLPDVERVLYLDADTIAVDSLAPLWRTELAGSYLAAVPNVWAPWDLDQPVRLGLPDSQPYFNSGVLLMNLELMRLHDCTRTLYEFALTNRAQLIWPDQDTLNLVLGADTLALHPRWNVMNSILEYERSADVFGAEVVEQARRDPGIRHFEGPAQNKPWHLLYERGDRELYFEHRRRTPWPRSWPAGVSPRNVALWLRQQVAT